MKSLFATLLVSAFCLTGAYAQNEAAAVNKNAPKFKFKGGETHDFGTLKEGPVAEHLFSFTNAGKEPLIIQNVTASCGCTTPDWTKQPILPGKSSVITVRYTTQGRVGPFNKDIYIQSNAASPDGKERYELHIKGTVTAADPHAKKEVDEHAGHAH
jgi:hypothetical protein